MEDIMNIVKSLEDSGLLLKEVSETIQNELKEKKRRISQLASRYIRCKFIRNMLANKGINRAGEGFIRAGYGSKKRIFNTVSTFITNFEIQQYYQNELRFNGFYPRDNLHDKIQDAAYVINLDEHSDTGTNWIHLCVLNNNGTYFDSFGVEHIPKEINKFIDKSIIITNIFRIQAYDAIVCGYFCIGFVDFILAGKTLTNFNNLFSPDNLKRMMIWF